MTVVGTATVLVDSDTRGFETGVTSKIGGIAKKAAGLFAAAFAGRELVQFFGDAIGGASDLSETVSKVGVVFGQSAAGVIKFGETAATALGQSKNEALAAAGTFGNLFRAIGIGEKPAADMSVKLIQLAGDLASFNNVSPTEALDALRSGLVGETEPLRKFGVNLNDATLRQKALELGLVQTTKEVLPPAIKAQASYALILEQTSLAQGDFARTSGGLANQQRIFAATIDDLKAKLGTALLPTVTRVVAFFNESLPRAIKIVSDAWERLTGAFAGGSGVLDAVRGQAEKFATLFTEKVLPALLNAGEVIREKLGAALKSLAATIQENRPQIDAFLEGFRQVVGFIAQNVIPILAELVGRHFANLIKTVGFVIGVFGQVIAVVRSIADTFGELSVTIPEKFGQVVAFVKSIPGRITDAIGNLGRTLFNAGKDLVQGLIDGVKSKFNSLKNAILNLIPGPIRSVVSKALDIASPSGVFFGFGENLIEGLILGIRAQQPALRAALAGVSRTVAIPSPRFTAGLPATSGLALGAGRALSQTIIVNEVAQDPRATAEAVASRLVAIR